jgi:hypothetical protein
MMYFLVSTPPYVTGLVNPACAATSTKLTGKSVGCELVGAIGAKRE